MRARAPEAAPPTIETSCHLVRHGWADWSVAGRGEPALAADLIPLTPAGEERVRTAGDRLRAHRPTLVVSSPVTRALQSAHLLARDLDLRLAVEPDLREWLPGGGPEAAEQVSFRAALAEMLAADGEWPDGRRRPWEPLSAVRRRVVRALSAYAAERLVVVTHGVVIYALTGQDAPPGGLVPVPVGELRVDRPSGPPLVASGPPTGAQALRLRQPGPEPAPLWDQVLLAWEVPDRIEVPALDRALLDLVAEHPPLRSRFVRDARGGADRREVLERGEIACWVVDPGPADGAVGWVCRDVGDRLSGVEWPLLRVTVVRGEPDLLCLVTHGLIARTEEARRLGVALLDRYHRERGDGAGRPAPAGPLRAATDPPSWAGDAAHHLVPVLDAAQLAGVRSRFAAGPAGLADIVLAALGRVSGATDPGTGPAVALLGGERSTGGPWPPHGPATRIEVVTLPPGARPAEVARLRRAAAGRAAPDLAGCRYVVELEAAPAALASPGAQERAPEPRWAAWRGSRPVLAFRETAGGLALWRPLGDGAAGRRSPHRLVADLLRRWATG
ncbi:histidine phosphatase family protein [Streptomyces sp. DSM 44915]|uniref:Histidine phosphatase family protein n=1 Tax=Streptomyces chisholmiae TaxID=3075540 RepID=A0ABU2JPA4_9ACTN|nr:histidine phosphatase family protein [Streptomyces sp. DSM 44915]MDT0266823.1 histidine phosphatase family protein [Streptomyces sp. DSM 44915]